MTEPRIRITVDGQPLQVEPALPLLTALRALGFPIPGLCHHPRTGEQGRCSLCIVEVRDRDGWRAEHACLLRCEPGLTVRTVSPHIHQLRSWAARLLLARGPFNEPAVEVMLRAVLAAAEKGDNGGQYPDAALPPLSADGTDAATPAMPPGCILCGRCIGMCTGIGKNKLAFLGRGKRLRIGYVHGPSDTGACGTCHACRGVCPTGFIRSNGQAAFSARLYRRRGVPRNNGD
ncbi:2Fe-2S iron-sulfur cluster binding domain-containing protein [Geobacter sp. FeAm09]|uniref:2Fe-2S iron-sulfur cluster-binding protein n=1 Tax=Geobacter sp. FeAm09 TaxID=2597769 RepID=UPI0011EDF26E|nr:2Fe-2S iron-sulfur cluster-binding protein [Geobacter sp. FeAm09]QEM67045.1 2Fe-2S iron-sulfur cluster binding domain-containing protein [Geobacter sp. FeAm09]